MAPPYVTSRRTDPHTAMLLATALRRAVADPALRECRAQLLLEDFAFLPESAYAELRAFETVALQHDYRELPAPRRSLLHVMEPQSEQRLPGLRGSC